MKRVASGTRRSVSSRWNWRQGPLMATSFGVLALCASIAFAQNPFPGAPSSGSLGNSVPRPERRPLVDEQSTSLRSLPGSTLQEMTAGRGVEQASFSLERLLENPLADVQVEGNKTIPMSSILQKVESRPGRIISPKSVQRDVKSLLDTRWFFDVRTTYREGENGPILVFQVVERPMLKSIEFIGNKKIKTAELQEHTGLYPGVGYDVSANRESAQRIKSLYVERGYRFAEVKLEKGNSPDDREVVFQIQEGPKVKIWEVNVYGNKYFSKAVLKTKLKGKTVKVWIIGGDYDPDIIRNDVLALKEYYMNLGFFDVEIHAEEEFSDDKSKVTVNYFINEGTRYKVRNMELIGNEVVSTNELVNKPKLKPGDAFNARFLKEDVSAMKDIYDEQGRIFAEVKPVPQFIADEEGWVDLVYEIDEDIPRYIGTINIRIRGESTHTREDVVRKQVDRWLKPGTLASGRDVRMATSRLNRSGIWDVTDAPMFDIRPVDGKEYLPSAVALRGQDDLRDSLRPTSAIFEDEAEEQNIFGHSFAYREVAKPVSDDIFVETSSGYVVKESPFVTTGDDSAPVLISLPEPIEEAATETAIRPVERAIRSVEPAASVSTEPAADQTSSTFPGFNVPIMPPEMVFRAQSPGPVYYPPAGDVYRSQNVDAFGNPVPQDYIQGSSPQGDPFGDPFSNRLMPPPGFVDVNIDVTEGRTGRVMFGVGVNSDAGVVGQITLQEDNFDIMRYPTSWADVVNGRAWRGAGQSFRLEAIPGSEVSRYMMTFQDPYFMRTDFSLGVSAFYYNRFFRDWTEDRLGGRISLGYILDRYWSVSTALRLENVQMRNYRMPAPQDVIDVDGNNFLSTGAVTLSYDTRDNAFMPSRGHNASLTFEQGFGEFNYPRLDLSGSQFFTLYERPDGFGKHILSLNGQVAWTGDDTPVFERFYAGGYSSFRGFAFRGISPLDMGFQVGGNFMTLGSVEYSIPITADDNFRTVLFSDFGTVEEDVSLDQFRVSAGFGFRVTVPMMGPAPLAFDFAWPVMKQDFDKERVFSFTVGYTR